MRPGAALAPGEYAPAQYLRESAVLHQKLEHRAPKALGKKSSGHRRQRDKAPIGKERSVGGEHLHMWIEIGGRAKALDEGNSARVGSAADSD